MLRPEKPDRAKSLQWTWEGEKREKMIRQFRSRMKYIEVFHKQNKFFLTLPIMRVPSLPMCGLLTFPKRNPTVSKLLSLLHLHRAADNLPPRKRPILEASLHGYERNSHQSPEYTNQFNFKSGVTIMDYL